MWGKTLKEAAMILLVATVLSGASYALRPVFSPSGGTDQRAGDGNQGNDEISAIALEDAIIHFEKGSALFADARSMAAYRSGHIRGAIHLDPNDFDRWSVDFFSQIPPDRIIISYCEGARCTLGAELAEKLAWMGYEQVYYLKDGLGLWKKNKLPMDPVME
jgi:rhodanese-related sulfurtransferase